VSTFRRNRGLGFDRIAIHSLFLGAVLLVPCAMLTHDFVHARNPCRPTQGPVNGGHLLSMLCLVGENSMKQDQPMTEDHARKALIGLLKRSPHAFATSVEEIQSAKIARQDGYVEIGSFHCYLKAKQFTYGPLTTKSGEFLGGIVGVFYLDENKEWTAKVKTSLRK
jgi:hypothetical protein